MMRRTAPESPIATQRVKADRFRQPFVAFRCFSSYGRSIERPYDEKQREKQRTPAQIALHINEEQGSA
jgi:hypothetical protein